VLRHEVAIGPVAEEKRLRSDHNKNYLDHCVPGWRSKMRAIESVSSTSRNRNLFENWKASRPAEARSFFCPLLTVLTPVRDSQKFTENYARAWQLQCRGDFEIVLINNGALDELPKRLRQQWESAPGLRIISSESHSRGSALNLAISRAKTDLCIIADFEDISNAARVAATCEHFTINRDVDCASFFTYSENEAVSNAITPHSTSQLSTQLMLGLPISFSTFAFRKSSFPLPFDDRSDDRLEYDWFIRNMAARQIRGSTIPVPMVYSQERPEMPTPQIGIALQSFNSILGHLTANDRACLSTLIERTPIGSKRELKDIRRWLRYFCWQNTSRKPNPFFEVEQYFVETYRQQALEFSKRTQTRLLPLRGPIPFVGKTLTRVMYVYRSLLRYLDFFRWLHIEEARGETRVNRNGDDGLSIAGLSVQEKNGNVAEAINDGSHKHS
jgi:hypothetical protein